MSALDGRDGPNVGPVSITVTSTPTLAQVSGSALTERSVIALQPLGGDIYYGFENTVTTSSGFKITDETYAELAYGSAVEVWLVSASSVDTRVAELS